MHDERSDWSAILVLLDQQDGAASLPRAERAWWLDRAMVLGRSTVPGAVACSVTMQEPAGSFATPAFAGEVALALDSAQYGSGDGPCLSAARHHRQEQVDDMATDQRWPAVSAAAGRHHVRASLSCPLAWPAPAALNFYGAEPGVFADPQAQRIARFVARATSLLIDRGDVDRVSDAELAEARRSHDLVRRAQEVLEQDHGLTGVLAYRRLVEQTRDQGRPILDVALEVLRAHGRSVG